MFSHINFLWLAINFYIQISRLFLNCLKVYNELLTAVPPEEKGKKSVSRPVQIAGTALSPPPSHGRNEVLEFKFERMRKEVGGGQIAERWEMKIGGSVKRGWVASP